MVHGAAHAQLAIGHPFWKNIFVYVVILVGPLVALALIWRGIERPGDASSFLTMAGSSARESHPRDRAKNAKVPCRISRQRLTNPAGLAREVAARRGGFAELGPTCSPLPIGRGVLFKVGIPGG